MQKLYRHDFGGSVAIGIEDENPECIENRFYSFWNHGATSGELHWLTPNFAYFWTRPNSLEKALIKSSLFQLLGMERGQSKKKRNGLMPQAVELAQDRYDQIIYLEFLGDTWRAPTHTYKVGYLEYFAPDLAHY